MAACQGARAIPVRSLHGPSRQLATRAGTPPARSWPPPATALGAASPPPPAAAAAAAAPPQRAAAIHPRVRPIQPQPTRLTPQGLVPNTASLDAVPPLLQPLLEAAVAACRAVLGEQLVGVYARGSLVQHGCFVPGLSDADFLALHLEGPTESSGSGSSSGSSDSDSVAEALRQQAALLHARFPQCAKVELKSVPLPPSSPLYPLARQWQQQQQQKQQQKQQQPLEQQQPLHQQHAGSGSAAVPPSAVLDQREAALAFQLRTQAVCLFGWDLPRLLPDTAALPRLQLLPSLVDDVAAALGHAERQLALLESASRDGNEAAAESSERLAAAARAVRWALKRCLRAAFELAACCGGEETSGCGGGSSSSSSSSSNSSTSGPGASQVFSRDLYWCQHYAALRHPQLGPQLSAALECYVGLTGSPADASAAAAASSQARSQNCDASSPNQRQLQVGAVEAGISLAASLASELDGLFLQAMLQPEPGWLTHHHDSSLAASAAGAAQPLPSPAQSSGRGGSRGGLLQRMRVRLWAAAAAARGSDSVERSLVGAPPPPVLAAVSGSVLTLDWRQPEARQQAAGIIAAAAAGLDSSSGGGGTRLQPQPVLLKGAAAHWPAVQRWTLGHLAAAGLEGRARVAPSLQFPFTEPRLAALVAEQQGLAALPSCLARMDAAEFVARMQRGNPCGLLPMVYGHSGAEYLYFQAQLPPALLQDVDLAAPPFVLPVESRDSRSGGSGAGSPAQRLRQTQAARVWVGPRGAVSPTHYDTSHSFLTQIHGRKRMLFWSPDQLPCLYCYPDTHLLRRRSRVNMHAPLDASRFPLFGRAAAAEALLEPGDVVFFPSRWAHYTESLDCSVSVTCRFEATG